MYVLKSLKTREFYKGITSNINRRINEHLTGKSKSTKFRLPLQLVHVEICNSRKEARRIEKFFKSGVWKKNIRAVVLNRRDGGIGIRAGLKIQ